MAALRPASEPSPVWGTRLTEWSVMVLLVLVLGGVFSHYMREVRGQAELAQISSTLGALRTALVVAHLEATVARNRGIQSPVKRNPFEALRELPANYAGVADAVQSQSVPDGSWVFDPDCSCVGYRPQDISWLESPQGAATLWFRVTGTDGPLQIAPQQAYVWMGQVVH